MERFLAAILLAASSFMAAPLAAQDDDEGGGGVEAFRGRRQPEEIPTTADGLDARYEGAVKCRMIGDVDGALKFYEQILRTDPKALTVHIAVGTAHWEKGNLGEAEKWLKAALEINPRQIKARQFLGQLQMQSGRFTEAVETFNVLLKQELNLDDVIASAHLNLGKIALVRRQWNQAEKHFKEVGKSPERGDRATAEKGLLLGSRLRKTGLWNREQTPRLDVYFSPKIDGDAAWRKNWVETRDRALQRMYERVKWTIPEPIPVYVYFNNDDCYEITGQETAHTFRYSWWLVHTLQDATPGHDLAHQVVSRAWGSRPATVPLVEGFCDLLDGTAADRHAEARKLATAGKLRSLVDLHARQKEEEGMGAASRSFVAFAVAEYGIEKFIESFRNYNLVLLDPKYKVEGVKNVYKWPEALDEVFRRGLGESLAVVEGKWKKSLQ